MIKEILVAGIKLNNYTAIENLLKINSNLDNNQFTTIQEIYMKTLLLAKQDEVVRDAIENIDISVISEIDILDAVGENTVLRKREIDKREFFYRLMRILERNGYSIYILGETGKEVEESIKAITEEFPRLKIAGFHWLEECAGADEGIINDINMKSPDVILSVLPSPIQEHFLMEHKSMLLAKCWYGIGRGHLNGKRRSIKGALLKMFRRKELLNYESDVEE